MLLEKIKSPKELKELTSGQLQELVVEARTAYWKKSVTMEGTMALIWGWLR